ncbi:Hypothetical_protein [Hexamita inflata]|uniref:Hypothetical_protein n=1 Tax=Hexamita inflata TaxID=28002 RepID=A0AA86V4F2_9EUKA|nr:Hypothetical protein HINF_LOCUS44208 [Hexamita inflata]
MNGICYFSNGLSEQSVIIRISTAYRINILQTFQFFQEQGKQLQESAHVESEEAHQHQDDQATKIILNIAEQFSEYIIQMDLFKGNGYPYSHEDQSKFYGYQQLKNVTNASKLYMNSPQILYGLNINRYRQDLRLQTKCQ